MVQEIYYSKRFYLAVFIFIVSLLALVSSVAIHGGSARQTERELEGNESGSSVIAQGGKKVDAYKYLPAGATLSDPDKQIVFADLDGDGKPEITIFYTIADGAVHKANILVLKLSGADYARWWENAYDRASGFADPTGVYDVNKSGRPQIVAYRVVGASCPGVLDIYQYGKNTIEKITGDWVGTCQSDLEIKDLDGDGVREIIFRKLKYGVTRDIYHWSGKQYVLSNGQFAHYYTSEADELVRNIYSRDPFPAPTRVNWCKQVVQVYLLQRRYAEATSVCKAMLQIIDDPILTVPNSVMKGGESAEQLVRIKASLEVDKIRGKADVNRLLGDTYVAAGDLKLSRQYYKTAQTLEREAEEKAPALLR